MALSEATKELKFIYEVMTSMGLKVKLSIICYVDNVGAIFIADNAIANSKSKHIDTRAKYVSQYIADGFLKAMFVKTQENTADIFTKNVPGDILNKHVNDYVIDKNDM